ncbi:MAG: histidine kinase dimerization/phospho-acceptor domain-containing protein [Microthrixaceae bacterium]
MTVVAVVLLVVLLAVSTALVVQTGRVRGERERRAEEVEVLEARLARNNELEAQLASSLDAMHLGVVLMRRDGTTVFRNRAAERYVAARHGNALIEATVEELCRQALRGAAAEREVELYGPPMNVHRVRSFPLFSGDDLEPVGALVLVEDVTDGRLVDHIRRDFVANISHELRTPIGAIGLLAETIVDEHDEATVRRLALRMTDEADRVARTIEDLMELTRIEFGDDLAADELEFGSIIDEAVARIRSGADLNGVTIEVVDVTHRSRCEAIGVSSPRRSTTSSTMR